MSSCIGCSANFLRIAREGDGEMPLFVFMWWVFSRGYWWNVVNLCSFTWCPPSRVEKDMSPADEEILRSTNAASNPCKGKSLGEYVDLTINESDRNDVPLSRFVMF